MKRATITLPDELEKALEEYRRAQDAPVPLTSLAQAALREYLARRGFLAPGQERPFGITPAGKGDGTGDVSAEHDEYFAEAVEG